MAGFGWCVVALFMAFAFCPAAAETPATADGDSIAQPAPPGKKKKKNALYRFFQKFDEYDTTYITPNYYNYSFMLQNTTSMELIRFGATDENERRQSINFSSSPSFKVGPYFGWRWIFFGYSFDVANFDSSRKKSEFRLSRNFMGINFV